MRYSAKHSKTGKSKKFDKKSTDVSNNIDVSISNNKADMSANAESPAKRSKKNIAIKVLITILCVLLAVIIALATTITVMHFVGKNEIENDKKDVTGISTPDSAVVDTKDDGKIISYKSKDYHLNESIITMLCIGVDKKKSLGVDDGVIGTAGQADALYLLAIDLKNNKCTVVGVSRDTIADVDVYSANGSYMGQKPMQLCLSYAYGDGYDTSCENTVKAVSRSLYGLNIDMYFAMEIGAIAIVNDIVGGVTVTPSSTFTDTDSGTTFYKGVETTLHGMDAEGFVRYRDRDVLDSNNERMQHQKDYITAFIKQLITATKSDLSAPVDVYNVLDDYSATNLTASKLTYIVTSMFSGKTPQFETCSINGTVKAEGGYAAFYPDEDSLMTTLVNVFYVPLDEYNSEN